MRPVATIAALLALAGCQYIPGTDSNVSAKAEKAAAALLRDPASAQFRNVAVMGSGAARTTCGEINGKNGMGAYAGFTQFLVKADGSVMMDPGADETYDDYREAENTCISLEQGDGSYSCRHARDIMNKIVAGAAFHTAWSTSCHPG